MIIQFALPILSAIAGIFFLRRATVGLESHLKRIAFGFLALSVFELLSLASRFSKSTDIDIYKLTVPFGALWILSHLVLLVAILAMRGWVFGYLFKRLSTQLFIIFTTSIVAIFLIITLAFTSLLLKNLEDEALDRLATDVKVLNFALDIKKESTLSDALVLGASPTVIQNLEAGTKEQLPDVVENFLLTKKESSVVITSDSGQIVARGEDRERIGDSISDDAQVKRAILGKSSSSIITRDGVLAPIAMVRSAVPVEAGGRVVGVVLVASNVDNNFIDGIKRTTGLEAMVYVDRTLSASTVVGPDGKSRYLGIKNDNIKLGESYTGSTTFLNTLYFGSYLPLKDVDENPVGTLLVAKPQRSVLAAAGRSIELTFIITVVLITFSTLPAYFVSKYISGQLQ